MIAVVALLVSLATAPSAEGAVDTWAPTGPGLPNAPEIRGLAVAPSDGNIVYAGTEGPGIYKSVDGGATWLSANQGIPLNPVDNDIRVRALAVDPTNPAVAYASAITGAGVFKTTNGGDSWAPAANGLSGAGSGDIVVHPANPSLAYVAGSSDVFRTVNAGGSWASATMNELPGALGCVNALTIDPTAADTLYAAGCSNGELPKTVNGGASWTYSTIGASNDVAVDAASPQTVYAVGTG